MYQYLTKVSPISTARAAQKGSGCKAPSVVSEPPSPTAA